MAAPASSQGLQIWFVLSSYDPEGHAVTHLPFERYLVALLGEGRGQLRVLRCRRRETHQERAVPAG